MQTNKNTYLYSTLALVTIIITFVVNNSLITIDTYYNTFQAQLESSRIDEIFDFQLKYNWIGYILIPFWILLKNTIVAVCLIIGLHLNDLKLRFEKIFTVVLTADFVFLLPQLIKLWWFLVFKTDFTLLEFNQFYPLSALNLFKIENLSALLIYPFQTFSVFEILYWLLLAGGIKQALDSDINQGIKVVFSGYIPALALWILCVMFITVSLGSAT